jgi:hypothetical protein
VVIAMATKSLFPSLCATSQRTSQISHVARVEEEDGVIKGDLLPLSRSQCVRHTSSRLIDPALQIRSDGTVQAMLAVFASKHN